jgi:protein ImuB
MCIWIVEWPIQRLALARPDLHGRTVVIYEAMPQGGLKVVAATAALGKRATEAEPAAIAGIYPGMPLAEATALIAHAQQMALQSLGKRHGQTSLPVPPDRQFDPHLEPADPEADRLALEQLAEWSQRFSPIVGIEDAPRPDCLLLDVTGLAHLFGGEPKLAEQVVRAFVERGLCVRIAIADTVGAAWAGVHSEGFDVQIVPSDDGLTPLASLPIGYLRVAEETVALLATLGITRVGQLATLPRSALLARFGPDLLRRFDQAMGRVDEIITARRLPPEYAADFTFEAPIANREAIEQVLGQLIARVTEPLARRREGMLRLACRVKYERAFEEDLKPEGLTEAIPQSPAAQSIFTFSLSLFRSSASPEYLCDLLRLRLESVRFAGPVTSVHVEVTSVAPLELCQQALFEDQCDREQPRRLAGLVDRLSNRLGRGAVVQVALLPDAQPEYTCVDAPLAGGASTSVGSGLRAVPNFRAGPERHRGRSLQNSRRSERKATQKRSKKNLTHVARYGLLSFAADERPLWLLPQPARIEVVAVTPHGVPAQFHWAGRAYSIAYAWGPERIETGWWRTASDSQPKRTAFVRRDYYRIETTAGARFWIFRQLVDRQWFLHGRFD